MTDSMKFGPEWLRNLAGDSCNSGGSGGGTANLITPRYQLAEHRYGREEMLALFDRNCKPPESIIGQQMFYVEKTQLPLAFIPETEDETRLRSSGLGNTAGGRGRGGSVDRGGRIRTGRGGIYTSHFSRGFDDSGEGGSRLDAQSYPGRNRNFDRSQSERGWSERNGNIDANDWNGSTSPRKELSRGPSGSSLMESNWRRHRGAGDDEDGWRSNNTRIRSSWRDGGGSDRDRLDRVDADGDDNRISGRWEARPSHRSSHDSAHHHHHPPPTRTARTWDSNHHDNHDNLPEWATENPAESGGSFDASGAFHGGMFSDDDDDGTGGNNSSNRTRRVSEGTNSTNIKSNKSMSYSNNINQNAHRQMINDSVSHTVSRERPKSLHPFEKDNSGEGRTDSPSKQSVVSSNNTNSPLSKSTTMSSLNNAAGKKVSNVAINPTKINSESERVQLPQRSKSFVELPSKNNSSSNNNHPINSQQTNPVSRSNNASIQKSDLRQENIKNTSVTIASTTATISAPQRAMAPQKLDDDLERFKEEADMQSLVAKLMADEESHREETGHVLPSAVNHVPPLANASSQEKWYYRDPQGEVQGPFIASEMAEWCKAGYFTPNLLVRRTCDERYATLGDLMKICGRVPFTPGPPIPPLKLSEPVISTIPPPVPTGLPGSALPKSGIEDPLLMLQYQQLQMIQNQQLLLRQMKNSAIAKLSQSDSWSGLSPIEQNQLVMQCVMQNSEVRDLSLATNPFVTPLAAPPPPATNPVMQLFNQMQQAKVQSDTVSHLPSNSHSVPPPVHNPALDPIQQLIQQMGGIQNLPGPQPSINPSPMQQQQPQQQQSTPEEDPIKSLLRQLHINANGHSQSHQMDSIWPQPPPQINPQFNAQNWLAQVGPLPAMPPGQMPNSLWDLHTKDIKTEQQILEEQNIRIQERKEELRKQEELKRQAEDASNKRKLEEEQNKKLAEAQRKEEERKRKEEEKRLKMEEKRKIEEELKKKEDKKRKEEERKREEKRKLDEENNKKKQEEEKKKREEAKRQEEKLRKEEEKRKKAEEEQKRLEEERLRREEEEEARKKAEAEEQARRNEQRRREAEALRKLQEKSKAPWAQAPHAPPPTTHASLAEIQRLEREKKAEELRLQQLMQQQLAQQKALKVAEEAAAAAESNKRLTFKWAEKAAPTISQPVKSLAQIQQEEQERIVKVKQQEKERSEKTSQKEAAVVMQNAGIWGSASQSLNWTTNVNSVGDAFKFGSKTWTGSGFWDEPVQVKPAAPVKQPAKNSTTQQQQQQQQQNNKTTKNKAKKEEETVKKLFENNTAKTDDFTQWCNRTLSGLQVSVDVPTFVGFLRDIESAYEVKEYIKLYLGDNKQCTEFAKQFLEKRSKWRSSQRPQTEADDLCKPAPAVNPNAPTEFQEVKGKSKKPKKGKMFKVDNRILGFSVTAATDRINVGDRDYGEGV
ncbi:GSCOCG00002144001-RA-CDS [Cotesia congregata]|nr:GSCOCG00002144001-RA-CDS [Cotesia congregata]